jgi:hypothetical protein
VTDFADRVAQCHALQALEAAASSTVCRRVPGCPTPLPHPPTLAPLGSRAPLPPHVDVDVVAALLEVAVKHGRQVARTVRLTTTAQDLAVRGAGCENVSASA